MKSKLSIGFDLVIILSSIIFFFVFYIRGYDFYVCLIPFLMIIIGIVTLIVSLKKSKDIIKKER